MSESIREERERLLNRLAEIDTELKRLEPAPAIDQVWREIAKRQDFGGGKFVVRERHLATIKQFPQLFEFVCDRPHGDGDFDYICGFDHCRCTQ